MRIAILTQPLKWNYGGALQNYALQQVLIKLGHEPITLEKSPFQYISNFRFCCELPKRIITKYLFKCREFIFSEKKYNDKVKYDLRILRPFIAKRINRRFIKNYNEIDITEFDAFIVGSDQVWRPQYNLFGLLENMFLSFISKFAKIKRIAYAASFGASEWEYDELQTTKCAELIKRFDAVSTREINGIELCREYLEYNDAISVLDPTLLLDKNDYMALCFNIEAQKEDILFAYILDKVPSMIETLENIAKQKGLILKLVSAEEYCTLSIEEWLAMFRDAKCIITDSFHGTVFSIIFNKEFYTITNQSRGGSRFTSLLSQLSLTDKMYDSISKIENNENIDWFIVNDKLEILKEKSINFLKTNLS